MFQPGETGTVIDYNNIRLALRSFYNFFETKDFITHFTAPYKDAFQSGKLFIMQLSHHASNIPPMYFFFIQFLLNCAALAS